MSTPPVNPINSKEDPQIEMKQDDDHAASKEKENSQPELKQDDGQAASKENPQSETKQDDDHGEYPNQHKRIVIMIAVFMAMFLTTLDQNIITTAIPRITDEFHSIADIGWYGSAYLLTLCGFQLLMGKIYKIYPAKPTFLTCITLFEVGSVICATAPSSNAFIVGRAIAGIGSAGMYSGAMVIIFLTVPLQQRPMYQGFGGGLFALASVIGPLLGGTFTDKVTWRFCFWLNLPVGGVALIGIFFILKVPHQKLEEIGSGWISKIMQLDPIGNFIFFPGLVCLIIALQWGGTTYAWRDARIIVLLVLCGVLSLAFILIQIWKGDTAMLSTRLLKQRSMAASLWFSALAGSAVMILTYYLPIWFQAIKGVTAVRSGILLLPLILLTVFISIFSGILVSKLGYYTQFFILSSILMSLGAGLLTTLTPDSGEAKMIGYQVLFGIGIGFGIQQPMNVVLTTLDEQDVSTGSAIVMFIRYLGSVIFLPVAQNVFLKGLTSKMSNVPGVDHHALLDGGVTQLRHLATGDDLTRLISDYNDSIVYVFYLVTAMSAATILGSVLVEWRNLKVSAAGEGKAEGYEGSLTTKESSTARESPTTKETV